MRSIIEKNTEFSNKCELPQNDLGWDYLEFSAGGNMLYEEFRELIVALSREDKVETLDACYDISVIALNIAYKLFRMRGFDHEQATTKTELGFHRVLDSNLSKIKKDGTVEYKEDGKKVKKPDTFFEPELKDLL